MQPKFRYAFATMAIIAAVAWLWIRATPPKYGWALFGLWRVSDVAVACLFIYSALLLSCRSGRAVLRVLLATGSGVLTWCCAEAVALVLRQDAEGVVLGSQPLPHVDIKGETFPDIARAWGLPADPQPFHYTTNLHGHRNLPGRDSGEIFCVGDSFLVSAMLDWPDGLVHRLEQAVGKPCVNVALVGLAPQEAQIEFERVTDGQSLQGKVVLQFLCEDNDLLDSARLTQPPTIEGKPSLWRRSLLHRAVMLLQQATQPVIAEAPRRTALFSDTPVRFLWIHERGSKIEEQCDAIEASLDSFRARIESRGGQLGVVLIPQKLRVLASSCNFPQDSDLLPASEHMTPLPSRLAEWSRRTGTAFLDLSKPLQAAAESGALVWLADDTHWSAAGTEVAVTTVADWDWLRQILRRDGK